MYESPTSAATAPTDTSTTCDAPGEADEARLCTATGGADRVIELGAPSTHFSATLEAQLRADVAEELSGEDGDITEAEGRQLNDLTRELGGVLNATHGRMVLAVARVLCTGWWAGPGILTVKQWLTIHWATNSSTANRIITVAKAAAEYPAVVDALTQGVITLEAAHLICTRVPAQYQESYVGFAREMTHTQLRTSTRALPAEERSADPAAAGGEPDGDPNRTVPERTTGDEDSDPETTESAATERTNGTETSNGDRNEPVTPMFGGRVGFSLGDDGRWRLTANLTADEGALVEAALQASRDRLFKQAEDPDESSRITWADAFVDVARRSLDAADADTANGQPTDRTLIHFHLHYGGLYPERGDGPVPDAVRRQLLCDSSLRVVGIRDGRPVDLGRKTRVISPRLRRIILDRDQCCVVPGCGATRGLQIHHRIHWEDGGATDVDNLVALCAAHHRALHHGLLSIQGSPSTGLTFTNADGRPIEAQPPLRPADTTPGGLADTARRNGMAQPADDDFFGASGQRLDTASVLPYPSHVPPAPPPDPLRQPHPGVSPPRDASPPSGAPPSPAPPSPLAVSGPLDVDPPPDPGPAPAVEAHSRSAPLRRGAA